MNNQRQKWESRYRSGPTPWDTCITPPEVIDYWQNRQAAPGGLALDIGCGPGTNAAFLAKTGLRVIGFDLAFTPLQWARRRFPALLNAEERARVDLVQSDVSCLPVADNTAVYALDVGCLHGLSHDARVDYANRLGAILRPGAHFQLFAFDRPEDVAADEEVRGMGQDEVRTLFAPHFQVVDEVRGEPDHRPCRWYLLLRR